MQELRKYERHGYIIREDLKKTDFTSYMQFPHICKYCIIVLNLIQLFHYKNSEIFNAVYI